MNSQSPLRLIPEWTNKNDVCIDVFVRRQDFREFLRPNPVSFKVCVAKDDNKMFVSFFLDDRIDRKLGRFQSVISTAAELWVRMQRLAWIKNASSYDLGINNDFCK